MKNNPKYISFVAHVHPEVILPVSDVSIEIHRDQYYIFSSHAPRSQWQVTKEEYERVRGIIMEIEK